MKRNHSSGLNQSQLVFAILGIIIICLIPPAVPAISQTAEQSPLVKAVKFIIADDCPNHEKLLRLAHSVNAIAIGQPFSEKTLNATLNALKISGAFQSVAAEEIPEPSDHSMTIVVNLKPFQRISQIHIRNASPLFHKEILNVMTMYVGDAFVAAELPNQAKLIEQLYQRQGFIQPQVVVTVVPASNATDNTVAVLVDVTKGAYWAVKKFHLTGNHSFSGYRLKLKLKTWIASLLPGEAGRFIEQDLKQDLRELTDFYKNKKYYDVRLDSQVKHNATAHSVDITLSIQEGPEYKIEFEGNTQFWNYTLKKDMVLGEAGGAGNLGIRKSIRQIKQRYQAKGFENVKITWESRLNEDQTRQTLKFIIDEGYRAIVKSLQIMGNQAISADIIEKEVLTRIPGMIGDGAFVKQDLMEDINAIKSLYLKNGFINAEVKENLTWSPDMRLVDVAITITEGEQQIIDQVRIIRKESAADYPFTDDELRQVIKLQQGEPLREYMLKSDENEICALISERGYPHVKAQGIILPSPNLSGGTIEYHIDPGPYVQMGQIHFSGNFKTRESILRNELEIETDMPFSLIKMLESQRNLRNLDVFNSVQFRTAGLKNQEDTVHLFADLEEKKPYFVQFSGGYDSQRSVYIGAKMGDRNLLGRNINAWVSGELSEIGYRADMGLTEPRLLGYPLSSTATIFTERKETFNQDFGVLSSGASVGFSRKWFDLITTGLTFQYERREQFMRDGDKIPENPSEYEPRSILITTPAIQYDSRDSFISPKSGIYTLFTLGLHKGMENSLDDFLKYRLDLRYFYTPIEHLTLAVRGYSGHIKPFGSVETVPDDQLFFLGGTTDVRGFKENMLVYNENNDPVGGRTTVYSSLEARIDLGIGFELTGFYDIGSIYDSFYFDLSKEFRSSVGLGLRYLTPIGPIGFLYGFKLNPREHESNSRLHFALGYTF